MLPIVATVQPIRAAQPAAAQAVAVAAVAALPACAAGDLTLSFDGLNGTFDGMQHGGTLMVVRNAGAEPCRLAALPRIVFAGPDGRALPIRFDPPPGMHPGPVVLPVGVPPRAEVTADLVWVQGDAFPGGRCYTTATIEVSFGAVEVASPFVETFCGPAAGATFGQTWLKPDEQIRQGGR